MIGNTRKEPGDFKSRLPGVLAAAAIAWIGITFCCRAEALELKITYGLIQEEVEEQYFQGGRSYLSGDSSSTCEYAYLQNPKVYPRQGQIALEANFNGKTGKEVLGKCIGIGKSFDIVVTGTPVYRDGAVRIQNTRVQFKNTVADAVFGRLLDNFAGNLERDLTFPLQADSKEISDTLNQGTAGYRLGVEKFQVTRIEVQDDAVHLQIDTTVLVESGSKKSGGR